MTTQAQASVEARLKTVEEGRKKIEEKLQEAERLNKSMQADKDKAVAAVEQQVRTPPHISKRPAKHMLLLQSYR